MADHVIPDAVLADTSLRRRCGNCQNVLAIDSRGICRHALYDAAAYMIWNRGDVTCGHWEVEEKARAEVAP